MLRWTSLLLAASFLGCANQKDPTTDGDADADADADSDSDADADADADADSDADGDGDGDADGDGDGDGDADGDADPELCNGLDDNGDGQIDEGDPEGGSFCNTGDNGVCRLGHTHCADGELSCLADHEPSEESCANAGADDDCNGVTDDIVAVGAACDTGLDGICAAGTGACDGMDFVCNQNVPQGTEICPNGLDDDCNGVADDGIVLAPETCANPGRDDDCDGVVDNVPEVGQSCDTGELGVCGMGLQACEAANLVCNTVHNPGAEICSNLADEDCDGQVDEAGCIDRTDLMRCGGSQRDVTTFIPDGRALNLVLDCHPTAQTQALLITRGGVGLFNAQELRDYLDEGGVVITEYNTSATIFNAAFEENVVLGARNGACQDNVEPEVQLNPNDRFWQDNVFAAENESGCGYDMAAYPGITPLGAWANGNVQLAYRDRGLGRLWLVEADWQDNQVNFDADSLGLMKYMVGWAP